MANAVKVTFTLDRATVDRLDRTSERLGIPKSGVVREAITEYAARVGRLSDGERIRMLAVFDEVVGRLPKRPAREVDREIAAIRRARRAGGRRTPSAAAK